MLNNEYINMICFISGMLFGILLIIVLINWLDNEGD